MTILLVFISLSFQKSPHSNHFSPPNSTQEHGSPQSPPFDGPYVCKNNGKFKPMGMTLSPFTLTLQHLPQAILSNNSNMTPIPALSKKKVKD
jgi:hypothetical protein